MGSSVVYQLRRRGLAVCGLDRFQPPHTLGSTHGQSRIIREAYWEGPVYVPLVRRAYQCWGELEEESGIPLLRKTGGLMLGPPDGAIVSGSKASAEEYGISHAMLSAAEVRQQYPGFDPPEDFVALWEERAGVLSPEKAVAAYLDLAQKAGAQVRPGVQVQDWSASPSGVRVETTEGPVLGNQLVLTLGAWLPGLLGSPKNWFDVERQLLRWSTPTRNSSGWPIALWEYQPGCQLYTIPERGDLVKAGIHHQGESVDPDRVSRVVTPIEEARIASLLAHYQPGAAGRPVDHAVCLYTNTPDRHFVIDWHPNHDNVMVVSPCSGHGFKFASAIGELVADLVITGGCRFDLTPFAFSRFRNGM
jgi:sarcosine oxidase